MAGPPMTAEATAASLATLSARASPESDADGPSPVRDDEREDDLDEDAESEAGMTDSSMLPWQEDLDPWWNIAAAETATREEAE